MEPHRHHSAPDSFEIRVLRQSTPATRSYWETFRLPYEPELNVTSVLQKVAAHPVTTGDQVVAPIAYDANCLEEG